MKERIVRWIRTQVRDARAQGIVMGLSGGIDSAVTAVLAAQAAGKGNLLALLLPCHSDPRDAQDALLVARRFDITVKTIDLSASYDSLIKSFPRASGSAPHNLKPRLRMLALYYIANQRNYLVCGTSNKSEFLTGYFTKFGDAGVDIMPLADLFKKEVVALALELGVPDSIIRKPPSAGLWEGQTDESEMGITYAELDDVLERIEKKQKQILPREQVGLVKKLVERSGHKRDLPKICRL